MFESVIIQSPKRDRKMQTEWEGFFPYYAGFSESFARSLLSSLKFKHNNPIILDPWNGSGTTTYTATSLGLKSVGIDINPVMSIIARTRLLPKSEADSIEPLAKEIIHHASRHRQPVDKHDPLRQWFGRKSVESIRSLESSIRRHLVGAQTCAADSIHLERLSGLASTYYVALFSTSSRLGAEHALRKAALPTIWALFEAERRRVTCCFFNVARMRSTDSD